MTERPPPFSALRAVEAATRHRSFTWAAKELRITHSAVSQAIRRLEADLGTTLFERKGGAMQPSEAAMRLAESYSGAARSLEQTLRAITGDPGQHSLVVGMPAELGRFWFGSKLNRLAEAMPDLQIEVRTGSGTDGGFTDLAIEFGDSADREADAVSPEIELFPVCSPDLLSARDLKRPGQVIRAPLIASSAGAWEQWAGAFNAPLGPLAYTFDDVGMALEAASQGVGVALVHHFVAEQHLESGRLVALPLAVPSGLSMRVTTHPDTTKAEPADRFRMWLRLEASRTLALAAARQGRPTAR